MSNLETDLAWDDGSYPHLLELPTSRYVQVEWLETATQYQDVLPTDIADEAEQYLLSLEETGR